VKNGYLYDAEHPWQRPDHHDPSAAEARNETERRMILINNCQLSTGALKNTAAVFPRQVHLLAPWKLRTGMNRCGDLIRD
jgi:hypothetical protein